MKISEAFNMYREEYLDIKIQAKRIVETHEQVKRLLIQELGDIQIADLTIRNIGQLVQDMRKTRSQNTIRNYLTRIRMVTKHLEMREITCLKSELIPIPKRIDTIPEFLTAKEVSKMINSTTRLRNKFIISLLYSSGIRLSELISLNKDQIQDKRFSIIGKGGKARLCFIDQRTEDLLNSYLSKRKDNSEALIVSYNNLSRMTPTNVQLLVKNAAKRAGINKHVTPHTLRHSFATNFLQNNGNLRYCQEMMGHALISTTTKYSHVTNRDLERQYRTYHTS